MARSRTTLDVWDIQVNYGGGWESEIEEFSWYASQEQVRSYRENAPQYAVRAVKRRHKVADYSAGQIADIAKQVADARERYWQRRRQTRRDNPPPANNR